MAPKTWIVVGLLVLVLAGGTGVYIVNRLPLQEIREEAGVYLPATAGPDLDLIAAIALAEGYAEPLSVPRRAHNPIDLVVPGWTGDTLGAGISVFPSLADGYARAAHQ